jgi:hypothetical protein
MKALALRGLSDYSTYSMDTESVLLYRKLLALELSNWNLFPMEEEC